MQNFNPYGKIIEKNNERLNTLEREIKKIPDVNILNFPFILLHMIQNPSCFANIEQLHSELDRIHNTTQSSIVSYALGKESKTACSEDIYEDSYHYLVCLTNIIKEVKSLKDTLYLKDIRILVKKYRFESAEQSFTPFLRSSKKDDSYLNNEWEKLDL
jgi:hypothetical protein